MVPKTFLRSQSNLLIDPPHPDESSLLTGALVNKAPALAPMRVPPYQRIAVAVVGRAVAWSR